MSTEAPNDPNNINNVVQTIADAMELDVEKVRSDYDVLLVEFRTKQAKLIADGKKPKSTAETKARRALLQRYKEMFDADCKLYFGFIFYKPEPMSNEYNYSQAKQMVERILAKDPKNGRQNAINGKWLNKDGLICDGVQFIQGKSEWKNGNWGRPIERDGVGRREVWLMGFYFEEGVSMFKIMKITVFGEYAKPKHWTSEKIPMWNWTEFYAMKNTSERLKTLRLSEQHEVLQLNLLKNSKPIFPVMSEERMSSFGGEGTEFPTVYQVWDGTKVLFQSEIGELRASALARKEKNASKLPLVWNTEIMEINPKPSNFGSFSFKFAGISSEVLDKVDVATLFTRKKKSGQERALSQISGFVSLAVFSDLKFGEGTVCDVIGVPNIKKVKDQNDNETDEWAAPFITVGGLTADPSEHYSEPPKLLTEENIKGQNTTSEASKGMSAAQKETAVQAKARPDVTSAFNLTPKDNNPNEGF